MKKFITIFFVFLFLSFTMNTISASAESKTLSQGIYTIRDSNFMTGVNYTVQNTSPNNKSLLLVIDSNQIIQEFIRIEPNSPKYSLKPFQSDYLLVIIGANKLVFS